MLQEPTSQPRSNDQPAPIDDRAPWSRPHLRTMPAVEAQGPHHNGFSDGVSRQGS